MPSLPDTMALLHEDRRVGRDGPDRNTSEPRGRVCTLHGVCQLSSAAQRGEGTHPGHPAGKRQLAPDASHLRCRRTEDTSLTPSHSP